jgi:hypothetical protein
MHQGAGDGAQETAHPGAVGQQSWSVELGSRVGQ